MTLGKRTDFGHARFVGLQLSFHHNVEHQLTVSLAFQSSNLTQSCILGSIHCWIRFPSDPSHPWGHHLDAISSTLQPRSRPQPPLQSSKYESWFLRFQTV